MQAASAPRQRLTWSKLTTGSRHAVRHHPNLLKETMLKAATLPTAEGTRSGWCRQPDSATESAPSYRCYTERDDAL